MSAKNQLLAQFDLHNTLFNNVLADIDEEEANTRLVPSINNIKWLAGHLLWGQTNLARMFGAPVEIIWIDHYNNQIPQAPEIDVPSLEEIKNAWNEFASAIRQGLENVTDEALNMPVEFPLPAFRTKEGYWTFINHHQAYTIGQIGILRRGFGKEAMKYI